MQQTSDVRVLKRKDELGCRNSWGDDQWTPADGKPVVVESRPVDQPAYQATLPVGPIEDEITSVEMPDAARRDAIIAASTRMDDDVLVGESSLVPEATASDTKVALSQEDDAEASFIADQEHRVEVMARGNRDAIFAARERWQKNRTISPDFRPQATMAAPERPEVEQTLSSARNIWRRPSPASEPATTGDHALRSHVGRTPPVPAAESRQQLGHTDADSRFDSVPELNPRIALPRRDGESPMQIHLENDDEGGVTPTDPAPADMTADDPSSPSEELSFYDRHIQRARALQAAAQAEREAHQKRSPRARRVPRPVQPTPAIEPEPEPESARPLYAAVDEARTRTSDLTISPLLNNATFFGRADAEQPRSPARLPDIPEQDVIVAPAAEERRELRLPRPSARLEEYSSGDTAPRATSRAVSARDRLFARTRSLLNGATSEEPGGSMRDPESDSTNDDSVIPPRDMLAFRPDAEEADFAAFDAVEADPDVTTGVAEAIHAPAAPGHVEDRGTYSFDQELDLRDEQTMNDFRNRLFNDAVAPAVTPPTTPTRTPSFSERAASARWSRQGRLAPEIAASAFRSSNYRQEQEGVQETLQPEIRDMPARQREQWTDLETEGRSFSMSAAAIAAPETRSAGPRTELQFDIRDVISDEDDYPDMTIAIAPGLSRSCATCRDFRPSEQGDRGWCMNAWAFAHRQMVNGSDLACKSTIGCWWLPFDEVWMPEERDDRPTPLVADLIMRGERRRRSG